MEFDSGFTNSIWTKVFDWIPFSFPESILVTVFDGIQLRAFPIQFNSRLTQLFLIQVT